MPQLPLICLRDKVCFPNEILSVAIGRPQSVRALDFALTTQPPHVLFAMQRNPTVVEPAFEDVKDIGVVCVLNQCVRLTGENEGVVGVVATGSHQRARIRSLKSADGFFMVEAEEFPEFPCSPQQSQAAVQSAIVSMQEYVRVLQGFSPGVKEFLETAQGASELSFRILVHLAKMSCEERWELLAEDNPLIRLSAITQFMDNEVKTTPIEARLKYRSWDYSG